MFERVLSVKCIKNTNSKNKKINLSIGKTYRQQISNVGVNDEYFGVFDDKGSFSKFHRDFFEIEETLKIENTRWTIQCNDCKSVISIDEFKLGYCPNCGQKVI